MTQIGMDGVSMEMMLDGSCALLYAKKVLDSWKKKCSSKTSVPGERPADRRVANKYHRTKDISARGAFHDVANGGLEFPFLDWNMTVVRVRVM